MSDERKRPTREEALRRLHITKDPEKAISRDQWNTAIYIMDETAKLLGGFAPSVVEVPVLEAHEGRLAYRKPDGDFVLTLGCSKELLSAIAARTNAWEGLKEKLERLVEHLYGRHGCGRAQEILFEMSRPEMGVGPKP